MKEGAASLQTRPKHLNEAVLKHQLGEIWSSGWRVARDVTNLLFVYKLTNKSVHTQSRV